MVAVQTIRDGLKLWQGTWFMDQGTGFPWLVFMGQKVLNSNQLIAALRAFLLGVPGVVSVLASATFSPTARAFEYDFTATLDSGAIITGGSSAPANLAGAS